MNPPAVKFWLSIAVLPIVLAHRIPACALDTATVQQPAATMQQQSAQMEPPAAVLIRRRNQVNHVSTPAQSVPPPATALAPPATALAPPGTALAPSRTAPANPRIAQAPPPSTALAGLSPAARDIARQLGIVPLIERIDELSAHPTSDIKTEFELLKLKHALNSRIMIAALQARDVSARIEKELALINRMRGLLEDKRDRAIKLNSMENVAAGGALNEIGVAGNLFANETPGEIIQLVAGAATIGLGTWALRQQAGAKQRVNPKPNMLAKVFNLPPDKESDYPPLIWGYLNSVPPGSTQTRLETLCDRWKRYEVIPRNLNTASGQKRIGLLTNTRHSGTLTIDAFNDQSDMLFDLRSEVFQMDRDLLELAQGMEADAGAKLGAP